MVDRALLLTDLVDSTLLTERLGDAAMARLLADHDRLARDLLPRFRGRDIDKSDGFLLLFDDATNAAQYAMAYHDALRTLGLSARAGLHVGPVLLRENAPADVARGAKPLEVDGLAKSIAARILTTAMGGQTRSTSETRAPRAETWRKRKRSRQRSVAGPIHRTRRPSRCCGSCLPKPQRRSCSSQRLVFSLGRGPALPYRIWISSPLRVSRGRIDVARWVPMNSYSIPNLFAGSTLADQTRLRGALMATPGVSFVTLSPSRSEISITFRMNSPVEHDVLVRAVESSGFALGERTGRWSNR